MLATFLMMFGSGFYMLQINRLLPNAQGSSGEEVDEMIFPYKDERGSLLSEGIFNQYLIILGDFGNLNFERFLFDDDMKVW